MTHNIALFSDRVVNKTLKIAPNHQILPVSTKNHQWWPGIPNNQPTWTTSMVLSHFMQRPWGLRKRKVLKSILHCICMIFISPGNSSVTVSIILSCHHIVILSMLIRSFLIVIGSSVIMTSYSKDVLVEVAWIRWISLNITFHHIIAVSIILSYCQTLYNIVSSQIEVYISMAVNLLF